MIFPDYLIFMIFLPACSQTILILGSTVTKQRQCYTDHKNLSTAAVDGKQENTDLAAERRSRSFFFFALQNSYQSSS
jgi:hypothetical protein